MKVIYWEKVPKFDKTKRVTTFVLSPLKAQVSGDSEPVCGYCGVPESRHKKRRRKHPFDNPINGQTVEVTFSNSQKHIIKNVQQGKSANSWTEKE